MSMDFSQSGTVFDDIKETAEFYWTVLTDTDRTQEVPEARVEDFSLCTELPGLEGTEVIVCGRPLEEGDRLDWSQGDNSYGALGVCGLNSAANLLTQCGLEGMTEEYMVGYAIEQDLCNYGFGVEASDAGGTTVVDRRNLIEDHGVDVKLYFAGESPNASVEGLAARFESGRAGIINLNAGYLWNDPDSVGNGIANHVVTMTGTVRDPETGELLGITVCDSGDPNPCLFVSVEKMKLCYEQAGGSAIFTTEPVRT